MIDKSDPKKWNPHTNRRKAWEDLALAVLCGLWFWRTAHRLAVRWAGLPDEMRWRPEEVTAMTLVEFLRARLDDDERWALASNRSYEYADEGSRPPTAGVHWQWVTGEHWDPVQPDPMTMDVLEGTDGSWLANLATIEKWPSSSKFNGEVIRTTMMPRTYADSIEEMDPAAAGHIARHDPARVLAEVDAKRRIVEWCSERDKIYVATLPHPDPPRPEDFVDGVLKRPVDGVVLRLLALPYAEHADYREEWRP